MNTLFHLEYGNFTFYIEGLGADAYLPLWMVLAVAMVPLTKAILRMSK